MTTTNVGSVQNAADVEIKHRMVLPILLRLLFVEISEELFLFKAISFSLIPVFLPRKRSKSATFQPFLKIIFQKNASILSEKSFFLPFKKNQQTYPT